MTRRKEMDEPKQRFLEQLSRELADKGRLIEVGFVGLREYVIAPDAPPEQVSEMRMAFMAGAQHLFASIMTILDPGSEPSEADMRRMGLISKELEDYAKELELRAADTKGSH